jgi:hypothetical protein
LPSAALASARINPRASGADRRLAEQALTSAQAEATLVEAQTFYVRQLLQLPLPSLQIPFCFAEQFGLPEVEQIAQVIAGPFAERTKEKGDKGKRRRGEAPSRSA